MANILRVSFDSKDEWPIKDVTVYEDRAQITRVLDYKVTDAGEAELKITNLPTTILVESIRAEISSGIGSVLAVTSETLRTPADHTEPTEREIEIDGIVEALNKETQVLESRKALLSAYYSNMVPTFESAPNTIPGPPRIPRIPSPNRNNRNVAAMLENRLFNANRVQQAPIPAFTGTVDQNKLFPSSTTHNRLFEKVASPENLQSFSEAIQLYGDEQQRIMKRQGAITQEVAALLKEKNKSVTARTTRAQAAAKVSKSIAVLVHVPIEVVEGDGVMEVKVTYVVNSCGWNPSYDVRVMKEEKKVDIFYYGFVRNGSGEKWEEVQMFLSTAKPAREGSLPPLSRSTVGFYTQEVPVSSAILNAFQDNVSLNMRNVMPRQTSRRLRRVSESLLSSRFASATRDLDDKLQKIVTKNQTTAQERGGSATFKLNRLCTIDSDSLPKKQSIGTIVLDPVFTHVMTPQLSAFPYLLCTARNNSDFIMVRGPMQVFFNGSYVTKTEMRLTNKNQEFKVFLGKDETLKMTIIPQKTEKELWKGGIMGSKINKETFSRAVRIENTGKEEVSLIVYEQIPLARDNKIKVIVLKPNLESKDRRYKVSDFNHLEAKRKLAPGKSWKFKLSYRVEWPKNTNLVYTESLENIEGQIK